MFRRLGYVDQETGFFTEKYLTVLDREADKKDIHNATVIHFKTSGDSRKLAEILKYWEPEHSKIVMKSDGEFLVQEHCAKEGLQTEASYEVIRKDSAANA